LRFQLACWNPDVVDRAAEHQAQRVKASLLDEQKLVDREVAGEETALDVLLHPLDPLAAGFGDAGERAGLVGGRVRRLLGRAGVDGNGLLLGLLLLGVAVVALQETHRALLVFYSVSRRSSACRVRSLRAASAART
jgi:hypothetical protein